MARHMKAIAAMPPTTLPAMIPVLFFLAAAPDTNAVVVVDPAERVVAALVVKVIIWPLEVTL